MWKTPLWKKPQSFKTRDILEDDLWTLAANHIHDHTKASKRRRHDSGSRAVNGVR
jgi:hypothetical protein